MQLAERVYKLSAKLPSSEQYGLVAQIRRSTVSVPSNIAEGYGRQATGEYRHHLSIARGSLLELETQLLLCAKLGFFRPEHVEPELNETEQLSKMLASLIAKLR
jgi:four helix bundle protein